MKFSRAFFWSIGHAIAAIPVMVFLMPHILLAAPVITNVSPSSGSTGGGTTVTVTGTGFSTGLYRRPVTVANGGGDLTNIQVSSTLDTSALVAASKMRSDCGDLRVLDSDLSTSLQYWVEDGTCNTTSTVVWTKVPSLLDAGKTVYFTYGDSSLTSAASGTQVFLFFDDFNSASLSSVWTTSYGTPSISNGRLSLDTGDGVEAAYFIPTSTVWETSGAAGDLVSDVGFLRGASTANAATTHCVSEPCVDVLFWLDGFWYAEVNASEQVMSPYSTTTERATITFRPGGADTVRFSYRGGVHTYNGVGAPTGGVMHPVIYAITAAVPSTWNWWFVRQYATTTPSTSVGSETLVPLGVTFGGASATGISVSTSTSFTMTAPAHSAGAVDVVVTNPDGSAGTSTGAFTYITPGVTITELGGSTTSTEAGVTDAYTVVLTVQPTSTVAVTVSPDSSSTVSTSTIDFTSSTWNTPVTVTVTAVNDSIAQGTRTSTITHSASSSATGYGGVSIASVTNTITDNDTAGVTLSESSVAVTEGGATDSYTVVLNSQPTSTVTFTVSPDSDTTVSTSSIAFSSSNWDTAVTVTVTAVNDSSVEGTETGAITHAVSSGSTGYGGISVSSVTVTVTDNDTAAAAVSSSGGGGLGSVGSSILAPFTPAFQIATYINGVLQSFFSPPPAAPSAPILPAPVAPAPTSPRVLVPEVKTNAFLVAAPTTLKRNLRPGMRGPDVLQLQRLLNANGFLVAKQGPGSPGKETDFFGGGTYQALQKFQKKHLRDITKTLPKTKLLAGHVDTPTRTFLNDFAVAEGGIKEMYQLVLSSQPRSSVTVRVIPDNQVAGDPSVVVFTTANWDIQQNVVIRAIDDRIAEGVHEGVIRHDVTSADAMYHGLVIPDVRVTISDNDKAGIVLRKPASR